MLTLSSESEPGSEPRPGRDPERLRDERPAYRPYRVVVRRVECLSPTFLRVTLAGDALEGFGTAGLDQRIKLVFPLEGEGSPRGFDHLGLDAPEAAGSGWYERWRALPDAVRNPFRTYTVRAVRPDARELDVDFAVHGDGGPASRWVGAAQPGDELVVIGPDDRSVGWRVGVDWNPGGCGEVLLVGDETAVPAICGILEQLDPAVRATAFAEVPHAGDALPLRTRSERHRISWLPREGAPRGAALVDAVRAHVAANRAAVLAGSAAAAASTAQRAPVELDDGLDADGLQGIVWDAPDAPGHDGFYAWVAGETATVVELRRFLVRDTGVDRRRVAFMGYWRTGRTELD